MLCRSDASQPVVENEFVLNENCCYCVKIDGNARKKTLIYGSLRTRRGPLTVFTFGRPIEPRNVGCLEREEIALVTPLLIFRALRRGYAECRFLGQESRTTHPIFIDWITIINWKWGMSAQKGLRFQPITPKPLCVCNEMNVVHI